MPLHHLKPEVPGGLRDGTEWDQSVWPPRVTSVHYEFQDWFGDELITSFPVFLVSRQLGAALQESGLGGFELADATITIEEGSEDLVELEEVGDFRWLKVTGTAGQTPIGFDEGAHLIVDDQALEVFEQFHFEHCRIDEWTPSQQPESYR